jgi:predicted kinase
MPTLHFIYGLPGAGKTGLARQLAASLPAEMFCEDEYLAALGRPITTFAHFIEALQQVREQIGPLALRTLQGGRSVVFDFAGNTVAHRAWARSLAEAANAQVLLHVLDVPREECKRRVRARNATKPPGLYFGDVSDEMFDRVVPHIVPPSEAEGIPVQLEGGTA